MDHEYAVQELLRQEYGNVKWSIIKGGLMPIIIYIIGWVVSIWTDAGPDGTGPRASSWVLLCTPPVGLFFGLYVQHAIYDAHLGIVKLSQLKYSDVMSKEEGAAQCGHVITLHRGGIYTCTSGDNCGVTAFQSALNDVIHHHHHDDDGLIISNNETSSSANTRAGGGVIPKGTSNDRRMAAAFLAAWAAAAATASSRDGGRAPNSAVTSYLLDSNRRLDDTRPIMFYSPQVPQCRYVLSKLKEIGIPPPRILDVSINPLNEHLWRSVSHQLCAASRLTLPIVYDPNTGYALCGDPDILSILLWAKGYPQAMPNRMMKHLRGAAAQRQQEEEDLGPDDIEKRSPSQWLRL
ncbi:hypothetical protein FOZ61_002033, partial [Perkinsus olseni]